MSVRQPNAFALGWAAILGASAISGGPAVAAEAQPPADRPVYAERSRFSGTAGVVTFSTTRPRRPARPALADSPPADAPAALAPGGQAPSALPRVAAGAVLPQVLIPGVPSARSGVVLSSRFGSRADPFGRGGRHHGGLDFAVPHGSQVVARSAGVVVAAGWMGDYGNCVVIDHGAGVETRYGHLSRIGVRRGQKVGPGSILGLVGSTGRSTGPHLHYEVRVNGAAINPLGR